MTQDPLDRLNSALERLNQWFLRVSYFFIGLFGLGEFVSLVVLAYLSAGQGSLGIVFGLLGLASLLLALYFFRKSR